MPALYDVVENGTRIAQIAVNNGAELQREMGRLYPNRTYQLAGIGDRVVTLDPRGQAPRMDWLYVDTALITPTVPVAPPPPDPDPIIPDYALPMWTTVAGHNWRLRHVGRAYQNPYTTTVCIQAAPLRSWRPGGAIPNRAKANWKRNDVWAYNEEKGILVNKEKNNAYVFGPWRASYAEEISRLLGTFQFKPAAEKELEALATALTRARDQGIEDTRRQMNATCLDINRHSEALTKSLQRQRALENILSNYKPQAAVDAKKLVDRIQSIDGIEAVTVQGNDLVILTEHIFIESGKYTYDIGKFKLAIGVLSGRISIHNLTRQINGTQHPHVQLAEAPCLGELAATIPQMVSKVMFAEIVTVMLRYLRSVDVNDRAGERIVDWPRVDPKTLESRKLEQEMAEAIQEGISEAGPL